MSQGTERVGKEILPSQLIFDLILELAGNMKSCGLSNEKAVMVARETILEFENKHCGSYVIFSRKDLGDDIKHSLCNMLTTQLVRIGISQTKAMQIANVTSDKLFDTYSGTVLYVPNNKHKTQRLFNTTRNADIVSEYDKAPCFKTVKELCFKYNLGQTQIYTIIRSAGKTKSGRGAPRKERIDNAIVTS